DDQEEDTREEFSKDEEEESKEEDFDKTSPVEGDPETDYGEVNDSIDTADYPHALSNTCHELIRLLTTHNQTLLETSLNMVSQLYHSTIVHHGRVMSVNTLPSWINHVS
ncbi:hypothetical protein PIB30_093211, partial [Stylosanthes scabra]|nr:hypothetical protein [Stylosanthes scabra]